MERREVMPGPSEPTIVPTRAETRAQTGKATLVLLPGMDGTGDLFAPFLAVWPSDWPTQVIRYPLHDPLSYRELVELVRAALPPSQPVVLLGESFSGPVAVDLAASLGDRVIALVLCCSFVRSPSKALSFLRPLTRFVPFEWAPGALVASTLLGHSAPPELRTLLLQALATVSPAVLRSRLQEVAAIDASRGLVACRAPILYLRATRDRVVPKAACDHVVGLQPSIRVVEMEGPHGLLQAAPREAADAVMDFLLRTGLAGKTCLTEP